MHLKQHLVEMYRRYILPDILSVSIALIAGLTAFMLTHSLLTMALVASIAENIGFYGYVGVRAVYESYQTTRHLSGLKQTWHTISQAILRLAGEHAIAELIDIPLRPLLTYIGGGFALLIAGSDAPLWRVILATSLGLVISSIAASSVFHPASHVSRKLSMRLISRFIIPVPPAPVVEMVSG